MTNMTQRLRERWSTGLTNEDCRTILIAEQLERVAVALEDQNRLARENLDILKANVSFLSD